MAQIKMTWKNDFEKMQEPKAPEGFSIKNFPNTPNALEQWLDVVQYGLSEQKEDGSYYTRTMTELPNYEEDKCFFILKGDVAAATITVVCDYEKKDGLIHMVACKPEFRGCGLGKLLAQYAKYVLKEAGMETGRLNTDDWRIPAIKTYLNIGFEPDLSTDELKERWAKVEEELKK